MVALGMGQLVALTLLVWFQTHYGMDIGFAVSAAAMALGLVSFMCGTLFYRNRTPQGTILTPIAQNLPDSSSFPPKHPYMFLILLVPLYDTFFVPFARKLTGNDSGISPLTRIGSGLFVATFSMVSSSLMEKKRRDQALNFNQKLHILWITPEFLIFGLSEMFTAVGLIEFFHNYSPT
ncbi:protein NRT1/ PTR FAMILY 4.4-like [Prosopis cineraria]|uniref:protein NRT1/ PTR FAMILY 4.4-like n=1 Tax=Prosopis cineraria TaxID=364024 RepID=UPI00240F04E2|nr:protein NRT1/ PTR FAMILY 4.4-like [Prosopis cineraria]